MEAYFDFKKEKKLAKNKSEITEMDCIIIRKIDMINWKKFYEYDESLLSNHSKLVEWGKKMDIKIQSQQAPSVKILNTYNEIKNELSKGISIVNRDFITSSDYIIKSRFKNIKSFIGNKKILLHFNDISYGHGFIVKTGRKLNIQYVLIDKVKPFIKELPKEIMNAEENQLTSRTFVSLKSSFEINVFKKTNINQDQSNFKNIPNTNNFNNQINNNIENNISNNKIKKNNNVKKKETSNHSTIKKETLGYNNNIQDKNTPKTNKTNVKQKVNNSNAENKNPKYVTSVNNKYNNKNNIRNQIKNPEFVINEDKIKDIEQNYNISNLKDIPFTPMIGLTNIGQTCYMNAALQCFNNTDILVNYFLNPNKSVFIQNNAIGMLNPDSPQLSTELKKLFVHLWADEPRSSYPPHQLKKIIGEIDPLFKNFEANDAKDFINFIVMRLHEELNFVDNSFSNKSNLSLPEDNINPYNYKQVLNYYIYDFEMNLNSIISNIFYGTVQGEFECLNCKARLYQARQNVSNIKYSFQNYFFLNFPLEEVRKFIVSNQMLYMNYMNMRINPNLEVNLIDCFKYYFRDEYMNGYCDSCGDNNAQILSRSKLFTIPTYLILLFNRGKGIQYNIKINFPEYLDTNEIALNPNGIYQLYGVVKHFGDSSASGHFTAYCRSPIDNLWYFYNDHAVTLLNENEKYKISEIGLTYILFYKKFKNK